MVEKSLKPSLSIKEFEAVLKMNGIQVPDSFVASNIYNFFINRGMNFEQAKSYVRGAKRRDRLTADWVQKDETGNRVAITFTDAKKQKIKDREIALSKAYLSKAIRSHCEDEDRVLFARLSDIDSKFKEVYKERKQYKIPKLDVTIRSLYEAVKRHGKVKNEELELFIDSEIEKLYNLASVYSVLVKHFKEDPNTNERVADKVMGEKLASLISNNPNIPIDKTMETRVDKLLTSLEELTGNLGENERFNSKELQQLIKKVPSLLYATDASKANGARIVLSEYLNELKNRAEDEKAKEFLSEATAKKIILKVGSLLQENVESLDEATSLMLGKTAGEVLSAKGTLGEGKRDAKRSEFVKNFSGFRIEGFTVEKQLYLIKNNASILSNINLLNIMQTNNDIINIMAKGLGINCSANQSETVANLKKVGVNPEKLIHADNVVDLLQYGRARTDFNGRADIIENIKFLSKLMPAEDVQKIVKHNYAFLYQKPEWIKEKIEEIYKKNKSNHDELKDEVETLVNSFYKYKDINSKSREEVEKRDVDSSLNKDKIKFSNEKEYINLNLFSLKDEMEQGERKKINQELTKENYSERLFLELAELKGYLDSKQFNKLYVPNKTTTAHELYKCGTETDTDKTKGAFKRKFKNLCEMAQFLVEEKVTPAGVSESLTAIEAGLDLRMENLKLLIAEGETIADPIALDFKTRLENSKEKEKDYLEHVSFLKKKIESLKSSPQLKEKLKEEMVGCELLLEQLREERTRLKEEKEWMKKLYQGRASWKNELKFLSSLYTLLSTTNYEIKGKNNKKTIEKKNSCINEVEKQIKLREIECLEAVIKDNKQRYEQTYLTDRDKLGSHAKKWNNKIHETEEKLERLKNELNLILSGKENNTD